MTDKKKQEQKKEEKDVQQAELNKHSIKTSDDTRVFDNETRVKRPDGEVEDSADYIAPNDAELAKDNIRSAASQLIEQVRINLSGDNYEEVARAASTDPITVAAIQIAFERKDGEDNI